MRDFLAEAARGLKPSGIRKYFDIVERMPDAISLGVGEPDFVTPWDIRSAGVRALQRGYTHYTGNRGMAELRALISRYEEERMGVECPAENVIVTVGASEGIDLTLRAACEAGDGVLIPDPSYVSYAPIVSLCGGVPQAVSCSADSGFIVTPEALEEAAEKNSKILILTYPNNPTGAVMTREELEKLAPVIQKYDLLVISDEIYAELTYGGGHVSIASLEGMRERTVVLGGFSKAFAMTGWRIGYTSAPKALDAAMLKIHQYTALCAPSVSQHAAIAALAGGFESGFSSVESMRSEYDARRRFLLHAFAEAGLPCFEPRGAFYVFPSVEPLHMTGEEFAERLLTEEQVAVVPGSAFGACGQYHVRCSYATGMRELTEAARRIAHFVQKNRKK